MKTVQAPLVQDSAPSSLVNVCVLVQKNDSCGMCQPAHIHLQCVLGDF